MPNLALVGGCGSTDARHVAAMLAPTLTAGNRATARTRAGDANADGHVDVVVCALALTHVADLGPPFVEFGTVLNPGGHLLISDVHHMRVALGSVPRVRVDGDEPGLLPAYCHIASEYLAAALAVGLQVQRCEEPRLQIHEDQGEAPQPVEVGPVGSMAGSLQDIAPAATAAACNASPATIIWHFQKAPPSRPPTMATTIR